MTNEQSGVKKTQARAEQALRELMLSGERISQYAVEKRAGLANGTLNYNCPEYRQVREAIRSLKKTCQGTVNRHAFNRHLRVIYGLTPPR
ncbi:Uncharacterised protein [Enterobacter hormaechei]|nr:Uncharacterised protein [Enterobacter hormaechei]SAG98731.1 Uncharacterised protein [Enterobacter hormaechei]